jgi:hypothetical protein
MVLGGSKNSTLYDFSCPFPGGLAASAAGIANAANATTVMQLVHLRMPFMDIPPRKPSVLRQRSRHVRARAPKQTTLRSLGLG